MKFGAAFPASGLVSSHVGLDLSSSTLRFLAVRLREHRRVLDAYG
ncbi:hypothetical protein [Streptomyces mirabilis]